MNSKAWRSLRAAVVLAGIVAGSPVAATQKVDLGTLGGTNSFAVGINTNGHIVGSSDIRGDGARHAFLWTPSGGMIDLGTLGGTYSDARFISDDDLVVGASNLAGDESSHAFAWTRETGMVDLGTRGGTLSYPVAMNAQGQVVGNSITATSTGIVPFTWTQAGGMVALYTFPAPNYGGTVAAVNGNGQSVGAYSGPFSYYCNEHAALWSPQGELVDLGTVGGQQAWANAINDAGVVTVTDFDTVSTPIAFRAFTWTQSGGFVPLRSLGGNMTEGMAINDTGLVVGYSTSTAGFQRAAAWNPTGDIFDIGLGGSWSIASAVSGDGVVIGNSNVVGDATQHAFMWTSQVGTVDLGTLGGSGSWVYAVNSKNRIVGSASLPGDLASHAVLWR